MQKSGSFIRESPRKKDFNYRRKLIYFITTNVKNRDKCFGEIINGKMILNEYGKIAHEQWEWMTKQYPYTKSHAFVVMPDHIHGLLEITDNVAPPDDGSRTVAVGTTKILPLYRLIGAYKTTTSKKIHLAGHKKFEWHRSFHDLIAYDQNSFERIINYIEKNPGNWELRKKKE